MKVSRADAEFMERKAGERWRSRVTRRPGPRLSPTHGPTAASALHAAINERGVSGPYRDWHNTLALLVLVRKNIATGAYRGHETLTGYIRAQNFCWPVDEQRITNYRRILRRYVKARNRE